MSGPKSSSYYLDQERRKQIAEQRQRERLASENRLLLSQCQVSEQKLQDWNALTSRLGVSPFPEVAMLRDLMKQAKGCANRSDTLSELTALHQHLTQLHRQIRQQSAQLDKDGNKLRQKEQTLCQEMVHKRNNLRDACDRAVQTIDACEQLTKQLSAASFSIIPSLRTLIRKAQLLQEQQPQEIADMEKHCSALVASCQELQEQTEALQAINRSFRSAADAQSRQVLHSVIRKHQRTTLFSESTSSTDPMCEEARQRCLSLLMELLADSELPEHLQQEMISAQETVNALQETDVLNTFFAVTVQRFVKQQKEWKALLPVYEALLVRCQVLCEQTDTPLPKLPPSQEAVQALQGLAEKLEQKLQQDAEQAYIRRTMDEVMTEMGYHMLGSRETVKKSGRAFRHELFTFAEGTAVDVTFADDGKITLELGGLGRSDRLPEDAEAERLCTDMEHFCRDFSEIECRLAQRGVLSRHIACLPPDRAYAQIINLQDYTLCEDADYTLLQSDNTSMKIKTEEIRNE